MTETNKMDSNEKYISCSRCKCKYHNTSESISKHFGYKRLGDRYKLCVRCRTSKIKPKVKTEVQPLPEKKTINRRLIARMLRVYGRTETR